MVLPLDGLLAGPFGRCEGLFAFVLAARTAFAVQPLAVGETAFETLSGLRGGRGESAGGVEKVPTRSASTIGGIRHRERSGVERR
jgi:hypothetical protein